MITRLNEFVARPGMERELGEYLASIVPMIEESDGCLYCHMLQGHDDPSRFVIIETWESIPAHQLSVQGIDRKTFLEAMKTLAETRTAAYYVPRR